MSKTPNQWEGRSRTTNSIINVKKNQRRQERQDKVRIRGDWIWKTGSVLLALTLWQLGAGLFGYDILLAPPHVVVKNLAGMLLGRSFWLTVGYSFTRILAGFLGALLSGALLAAAAGRFRLVDVLLWPYMTVVKSTPVASFIILCLIFLNAGRLSIFISYLIVLPIVYTNLLQGIRSADKDLLEMADVFRAGWRKRFLYIYLPQLKPYILAACSVSIGMAWKSGIAAEVIGIPNGSVGEQLYEAKVYLNSADLFAWTLAIVGVSVAFEKVFAGLLKLFYRRLERI
jgi:NitT/TauT family transport system permease protein